MTDHPFGLLAAQARHFADRPLLILPQAVATLWQTGRTVWTYAEALAEARALAARYAAAGYGPGHRVAVLLENRPAHFLHWLALNSLGVSLVPVNPDASADELAYLLTHSQAALLVVLPDRLAQVAAVAAAAGIAVTVAGAPVPPAPGPATAPGDREAAECALIYTSGTTARPKGCLLSNRYFLSWGDWYSAQNAPIALRPGAERLLTPLPCFHVNAMGNSFMGMLASGGAQVIVDRFHPSTWWAMAAETGATCFHYLGVMPAILLALPPDPADRAHRLRFGLGGGVHPDHHAAFEARFGVPLLEGWAMTETGGACLLCAVDEPRHVGTRCLGGPDRPGPAMAARLVGDDGADVPDGAPGELLVRAAGDDPRRGLFSGYLKNPAATAEIWDGGWLHTGDIMARGTDGTLRFVDRKKNIIRRSGENIASVEVEAAVVSHPDVAAVAVIAVPDPMRGEEVLAAVVPAADADEPALAASILAHCAARLAYFKLPGWVAFVDALPVTSTQKVRKADFGALAEDPSAQPRCHDLRDAKQALRH